MLLTAINTNEKDLKNYGEKFYDILDINEQSPLTNGTAFPSGNLDPSGTEPHKIVFVGDSVLLTVAQKDRAVKNIESGAKYVSERPSTETAVARVY